MDAQKVLGLFNWQVLMSLGGRLSPLPREFPRLAVGEQPLEFFCFWILCLEQILNFQRVMLGYPHPMVKVKTWLFPAPPWAGEAVLEMTPSLHPPVPGNKNLLGGWS